MEARGGVHLRGLGLVVEKDEGPRLVFRYDPFPSRRAGKLFMALADADFAKLFCAKKSLRDALVELQLEDTLFVSCPTSEVAAAEDSATYWGDDDDGAIDGPDAEGSRRLKFFDVIWACTGAAPGLCRGLVRWVEATLRLPVWLPVEMALYLQLEAAVHLASEP